VPDANRTALTAAMDAIDWSLDHGATAEIAHSEGAHRALYVVSHGACLSWVSAVEGCPMSGYEYTGEEGDKPWRVRTYFHRADA